MREPINAGTYNSALTATAGTLSNPLGYQYSFTAGDLNVTQAPLTVALPNTIVMTSQNLEAAKYPMRNTRLIRKYDDSLSTDETILSDTSEEYVADSRLTTKKPRKALNGLIEIHPDLVRLLRLENSNILF